MIFTALRVCNAERGCLRPQRGGAAVCVCNAERGCLRLQRGARLFASADFTFAAGKSGGMALPRGGAQRRSPLR